ncbi:MAG TPA: extracellular solute-binding protein [Candidatus Binatia bacterium]|nr:extracellular solute-binding protein [Verrucomicrobiae bacterium]
MKTPSGLSTVLLCVVLLGPASSARADSWDEVLAAAHKEGELVAVLGGSASRNYRPIFKHFEDKFGIRTVVSTGGGSKQADRLLAERRAGKSEVDIIMAGGTTAVIRLVPNGALDPIAPVLFLPEVVEKSRWFKGKHLYSDPEEKYVFAFSGTADASPVVMRFNTEKLPIEEAKKIDSVWTFLDKRFAGQIVALPPTIAGSGGTYFVAMVHPEIGEKFLKRFYDPELKVAFTEDFRQVADGVAKGKYTMAIFVGSAGRDIDNLGKKGLPVANFSEILKGRSLKERPVVGGSGASNNIMVANKRPHPNTSKLFLNWFLSKEGQTVMQTMSDRTPDQTFRVDVAEKGKVRKSDMRQPGVEYLTLEHDPEIQKKRLAEMKRAEDLYLQVKRR